MIKLHSRDRRVRVEFWTVTENRPGFPGNDPEGDMNLTRSDCDSWPPRYHKVTDRLAAYSCVKQGRVSYYIGKYINHGSLTLYAEYPVDRRTEWDAIVGRMAKSMRQLPRTEVP